MRVPEGDPDMIDLDNDPRWARFHEEFGPFTITDSYRLHPHMSGLVSFCRFCEHGQDLVQVWTRNEFGPNNPVMCEDPKACADREEILIYRRSVKT